MELRVRRGQVGRSSSREVVSSVLRFDDLTISRLDDSTVMHLTDTIIASSSAPSGGVRGIVRLSGAEAWRWRGRWCRFPGRRWRGITGRWRCRRLNARAKGAAVLLFKGPRSFTGEDVAEIQLPNSPAVLRACIDAILECGQGAVRLAGPGEFSARAFFNGKIDLTEAEGIAATINATTQVELRAAAGRARARCTGRSPASRRRSPTFSPSSKPGSTLQTRRISPLYPRRTSNRASINWPDISRKC